MPVRSRSPTTTRRGELSARRGAAAAGAAAAPRAAAPPAPDAGASLRPHAASSGRNAARRSEEARPPGVTVDMRAIYARRRPTGLSPRLEHRRDLLPDHDHVVEVHRPIGGGDL